MVLHGVLSLERTSLTCTRIWKAGQAVGGGQLEGQLPRPQGDQTGQEMLLGGGEGEREGQGRPGRVRVAIGESVT